MSSAVTSARHCACKMGTGTPICGRYAWYTQTSHETSSTTANITMTARYGQGEDTMASQSLSLHCIVAGLRLRQAAYRRWTTLYTSTMDDTPWKRLTKAKDLTSWSQRTPMYHDTY